MNILNKPAKTAFSLIFLLWATHGLAGNGGGTIGHSPLGAPVPGLGGVGLIALALLLAVVAVRFLRTNPSGANPLLVGAMMVTALAVGGSGIKLVNDAYAAPPQLEMSEATGGEIRINGEGLWEIVNATGSVQQITDIDLDEGCYISEFNGGSSLGDCEVGLNLEDEDSCYIDISCFVCGPQGGQGGGPCCVGGPQGGQGGGPCCVIQGGGQGGDICEI